MKKVVLILAALGFFSFLLLFFTLSVVIGKSVSINCQEATTTYGSDCVLSLQLLATDTTQTFQKRNDAIWTLGQIGDTRALTTLQELYTGEIPNREPYDEVLSQYELKKAITLIESGFNPTKVIWAPFL